MTKHWIKAGIASLVLAVGVSTTASSHARNGPRHAAAQLDGYQVNPSNSTTDQGTLMLRLDYRAETIDFELSSSALGPSATAVIAYARRRVNGAPVATLCGRVGVRGPCPSGGTVRGTMTAADFESSLAAAYQGLNTFEEFVRALQAGLLYVHIGHFRAEWLDIRGQIFAISHHHD